MKTKEEIKNYNKKYNKEHLQERKKQRQKHYQQNKEKLLLKARKYRKEHREECNKRRKEYRKNHKIEILEYKKQYINKRRKTNINFKLRSYYRTRIWEVLKGISKSKHTEELLGCTIESFKQHLEKQFKSGMSWNNYGKWHVDHIKPLSSFDLSKPEQQKTAFNYMNTQPLWAVDNLSKGDK